MFDFISKIMGYEDPAKSAMPYLNQVPQQLHQGYDPYANMGREILPLIQQQYGNLVNNPSGFMSQMGNTYHESPGYQWQYDQAMKGINNAAASGGMLGTGQHQLQAGRMASGLANQDYYNYMKNLLGIYDQGLQGYGNLNQMGFQANTGLADNLATALMNQGQLAYSGAANLNQMRLGTLGVMAGAASNAIKSGATGGAGGAAGGGMG